MIGFTKEKLLPLFQKCIEITANNSSEHYQYIVRRVPIECQIISTEPRLILSDGFHKVASELSIDAIVNLKKQYPTIRFKELTNYIITILDYEPYTYLDEYGNIRLKLNVYNFELNSPAQKSIDRVLGNPKKLSSTEEIKRKVNYETSKHLKNYLANEKDLDHLPPLEKILLNDFSKESVNRAIDIKSVLKCPGSDPGDRTRLVDYKRLNEIEDILTEEAGKQLQKRKAEIKRQKEEEREIHRRKRKQPESLSKELIGWADKHNKEESKGNAVTEGLIKFITIQTKEVPENQKESEVKYTAKGFEGFLKWVTHNHDSEENNVTEIIKDDSKVIKVDFAVPNETKSRDTILTTKKQGIPDKVISCCKSVLKKAKV